MLFCYYLLDGFFEEHLKLGLPAHLPLVLLPRTLKKPSLMLQHLLQLIYHTLVSQHLLLLSLRLLLWDVYQWLLLATRGRQSRRTASSV